MERNEIKKLLYRTNPAAMLMDKTNEKYTYKAKSEAGLLIFIVPISDMGDAVFHDKMDSKLLIRWLQE